MTALLDIDQLLNELETGLRQVLADRGVDQPALIGIRTGGVWLADILSKRLGLDEPSVNWISPSTVMISAVLA